MDVTGMFEEMERLRRGIDRLLGQSPSLEWDLPFSRFSFLPGRAARAYPLINLSEDENHFFVEALAPGLETGSLNIAVQGRQLTVSGSKQAAPFELQTKNCHRAERATGEFRRTVDFAMDVDAERSSADYRDGLLRITVPKAESAKPRKIEIRAD